MAAKKVLSKILGTDETEYFLLTTLHEDGETGIDLALVCDDKAWTGTLRDTVLERAGDKLKMEYEDYIAQTRKAFTRQNIGGIQFQYTMKVHSDSLTFTWKKHIPEDNIKIQLGTIELAEKDSASDVINAIFEHALNATTSLQSQISALQADKERLMSERASALKRLEKCVAAKEDMEREMFEKFAVVINDKKAKIRSLRDQVDGAASAPASTLPGSSAGEGTSGHVKIKQENPASETDELSGHDSEYETDEEKPAPPSKKARVAPSSRAPLLSDEDSLLLDDGGGPATPAGPRRRRRQDATKKQTPSRPVIPKGTSKDSTPRPGSRKGSMRRLSSNTSSRSNQSQDPDDLIDMM